MRSPLLERIEAKIDRSGGRGACHPWTGGLGQYGTPNISIGKRTISARRALWQIINGELPRTRQVIMTCDNRSCLNVDHMTLKPWMDPVTRFWARVNKTPGCWEWTGIRTKEGRRKRGPGYGQFMMEWRKIMLAHRYSWILHFGPIPDDMFVCHRCDNPGCVRPDHLFLGTPKENTQDMIRKGRQVRGPKLAAAMRAARERREQRLVANSDLHQGKEHE